MDLTAIEASIGLPETLPSALENAMSERGFSELTSVQSAVLTADSENEDLRISSQTGSGKTVAIGLALARHLIGESKVRNAPSVLLLAPTRELAMQVRDELHWLYAGVSGLRTEVVMGGASIGLERRALARNPQVVVGTPGRVLDHIRTGALKCERVAHVVLDEADRMLDMGFREELEAILEATPDERRTHLVSATFPHAVRKLADRFQRTPRPLEGTRLGDANVDIQHAAHLVRKHERYGVLVNLLLMNEGSRCLVFVERRIDASQLADQLAGDGFAAAALSGELPQAQRTRTINAFRNGSTRILVSTDVAARGIDVPEIELVVHADLPENADAYVHRSGRTGRAGHQGRSLLLVTPQAQGAAKRILAGARIEADWQPAPSASKVQKALRKRFRKEIHARLADQVPAQKQVEYARLLLEGRDPAVVIANLLELAQRPPVREPFEVSEPSSIAPERRGRSERGEGGRRPSGGAVRFKINWGERSGAATNRLLSHVCRRGQIQGRSIGAIEIGPETSTFDVDASIAPLFEKHARRRDAREPRLRIERLHSAPSDRSSSERPRRPAPTDRTSSDRPRHSATNDRTSSERPRRPAKPAPKRAAHPKSVNRA